MVTTYFIDPRHGNDKKGDGLTPETAYKTLWHGYFKEPFPSMMSRLSDWVERRIGGWVLISVSIGSIEKESK